VTGTLSSVPEVAWYVRWTGYGLQALAIGAFVALVFLWVGPVLTSVRAGGGTQVYFYNAQFRAGGVLALFSGLLVLTPLFVRGVFRDLAPGRPPLKLTPAQIPKAMVFLWLLYVPLALGVVFLWSCALPPG
jgi:hypothetical protein